MVTLIYIMADQFNRIIVLYIIKSGGNLVTLNNQIEMYLTNIFICSDIAQL